MSKRNPQKIARPSLKRTGSQAPRDTIRVLSIGHSYVIALNRATMRQLAIAPQFEVTLVAPRDLDGDLRRVRLDPEPPGSPLEVVGIDATFTRYPSLLEYDSRQLRRVIAGRNFDIVHAWVEPSALSARQIVNAIDSTKTRFCFWTFQNIAADYPPPFAEIEREVVARADRWFATGELVLHTQIDRGFPAEKGYVSYLGVDTSVFRPNTAAETGAVLHELRVQPPLIGFLGRLTEEKGIDIVMAALDGLDPSLGWSLLMMGSGPCEGRIADWANSRGLSPRVRTRLLNHEDVPRYLGAVDLLLAPSQTQPHWREQFARAVIEAFAAGVPVLVSDSGGHPFAAGDAARVLPETDEAAWAEAIAELLADESARVEMSRRGMERVKLFSTAAVAKDLAAVFKQMV
jgi:phosphatidyl-myo-inositol dimannoside synthase